MAFLNWELNYPTRAFTLHIDPGRSRIGSSIRGPRRRRRYCHQDACGHGRQRAQDASPRQHCKINIEGGEDCARRFAEPSTEHTERWGSCNFLPQGPARNWPGVRSRPSKLAQPPIPPIAPIDVGSVCSVCSVVQSHALTNEGQADAGAGGGRGSPFGVRYRNGNPLAQSSSRGLNPSFTTLRTSLVRVSFTCLCCSVVFTKRSRSGVSLNFPTKTVSISPVTS